LIGTQASIRDNVDPQTDHIDVDHPEDKHSETVLILYGKSSFDGIIGINAFSANFP